MEKPELNDLISWLHNNEFNRFEIYDVDRGRSLEKCASFIDLSKKFNSPEGYFKNLADDGVRTIQIAQKRKNGSSYIREECTWNYGLSINGSAIQNVAASGTSASPAATPQQNSVGLGMPELGLSGADIRRMQSQSDRYDDKERENTALKLEVAELKREAKTDAESSKKLTRENDRHEIKAEVKTPDYKEILLGLAQNPTIITTFMQSIMPTRAAAAALPPVGGLNSPQLSNIKSTFVDVISNNPQVTDDHVQAANYLLNEALKGNKPFLQEYFKLLENHNLTQPKNGSNNHNNNRNF